MSTVIKNAALSSYNVETNTGLANEFVFIIYLTGLNNIFRITVLCLLVKIILIILIYEMY